jgi:hypothetical protein
MIIVPLFLVVAGVLITASALMRWSFDFAIALRKGWHVAVFPPPVSVGVLVILIGIVMLLLL